MPSKRETSKYISVFVLIAALLPTFLALDLPVDAPAFSPSYVSIAPITGDDGSISAPPLSSSMAPSSDLNEASSSSPSKSSDLSPSSALGSTSAEAPAPETVIVNGGEDLNSPEASYSAPSSSSAPGSPNAEAPAPESVIVNGGEDLNSPGAAYSAPSYTEGKADPQAPAPYGGGDLQKVLPSEYRAEDEPVDPYPRKEETHGGVNGAVAGVMVGFGVVGLAGFVYLKKKNSNNVRAQYQYLGRNNMKKSVSL